MLIINAPFVNVNNDLTTRVSTSRPRSVSPLGDGLRLTSRVEATHVMLYDRHTATGVQKFAGTLGPYDLSSGNGTPSWRGNWQTTLDLGRLLADRHGLLCRQDQGSRYRPGQSVDGLHGQPLQGTDRWHPGNERFCYVKSFITVDLNGSIRVNDSFTFFANVGNVLNARAPIAPASYASSPNFLTTWHYAGLIGRTFKAGASFKF